MTSSNNFSTPFKLERHDLECTVTNEHGAARSSLHYYDQQEGVECSASLAMVVILRLLLLNA